MTGAPIRETDRTAMARAAGIDEAMIERLVHGFYDHVRKDDLLAPIFESRISDWGPHLERMCDFWSSIALASGRYHGQPMRMHAPLPISGEYFDRWLALFRASAEAICPPAAAAFFVSHSQRIAESLELGVAAARGCMLRRGERLMQVPHD